jgi:ComF family protein
MSRFMRVGRRVVERSLELLLPADCLLCARPLPWRQKGSVCLECWAGLPWAPGLRLKPGGSLASLLWAADYDGAIRRLILAMKFEGMDYLGRRLGEAAAPGLVPLFEAMRADLVVPVPLHPWRRYRRGYNQALLLAAPLARVARIPLAPALLSRPRAGRRQLGLSRRERLGALSRCYRARAGAGAPWSRHRLAGKRVLLVDDVVTTEATLEACARALLRAGAGAVIGCALARTMETAGRE